MKTFIERKHAAELGNYAYDFWADMKKRNDACFSNLSEGLTGSKTYAMPALSEKAYCKARKENSLFRKIATSVSVCDNDFSIFAVDGREPSSWVEEGGQVPTTDCVSDFTRYPLHHHKLATILRLHDDVITDSQFDIEGYLVKRLARNFAKAEDDAFINGTGIHMPTGILNDDAGAEIGVTTEALTYDDVIALFFSVDPDYRDRAVWLMNDATALTLRTMKDNNGNYLWNTANDTILGRPVQISNAMPDAEADKKPIAFGDFSYYWIVDREPVSMCVLRELYAAYQQTGYYASEYLDGRLIRSDAVKVLKIEEAE